jgi:hypothetical protein
MTENAVTPTLYFAGPQLLSVGANSNRCILAERAAAGTAGCRHVTARTLSLGDVAGGPKALIGTVHFGAGVSL